MRHGDSGTLPASSQKASGDYVYLAHDAAPTTGLFTDDLEKKDGSKGTAADKDKWQCALKMTEWISRHLLRRGAGPETDHENKSIPSGYTYLGQFIAHDLTLSAQRLPLNIGQHLTLRNLNSPTLDLDSIYRGGPRKTPSLYAMERSNDLDPPRKRLRLGCTQPGPDPYNEPELEDLPRASVNDADSNLPDAKAHRPPSEEFAYHEPLIGDLRNQDNLILAQMTVLFHKLHNTIIEKLNQQSISNSNMTEFEISRKLLLITYHKIIKEDFLKKLLHPEVVQYYEKRKSINDFDFAPKFLKKRSQSGIPIEFSMAAMRIGHAMIRQDYQYTNRRDQSAQIQELMSFRFNSLHKRVPITSDWVIDWSLFFDLRQNPNGQPLFEGSRKIRASIAPLLSDNKLFPSNDDEDLPLGRGGLIYRDLVRGLGNKLLTGQALAQEIDIPKPHKLTSRRIKEFLDSNFEFGDVEYYLNITKGTRLSYINHISKKTPLLLYILIESELEGDDGSHLGYLCSRIFAEVMYSTLIISEVQQDEQVKQAIDQIFPNSRPPCSMPEIIDLIQAHQIATL